MFKVCSTRFWRCCWWLPAIHVEDCLMHRQLSSHVCSRHQRSGQEQKQYGPASYPRRASSTWTLAPVPVCQLSCLAPFVFAVQRELELIAEALRIPGNKSLGPVAKVRAMHSRCILMQCSDAQKAACPPAQEPKPQQRQQLCHRSSLTAVPMQHDLFLQQPLRQSVPLQSQQRMCLGCRRLAAELCFDCACMRSD